MKKWPSRKNTRCYRDFGYGYGVYSGFSGEAKGYGDGSDFTSKGIIGTGYGFGSSYSNTGGTGDGSGFGYNVVGNIQYTLEFDNNFTNDKYPYSLILHGGYQ